MYNNNNNNNKNKKKNNGAELPLEKTLEGKWVIRPIIKAESDN